MYANADSNRFLRFCSSCARPVVRYRSLLIEPGTIACALSALLLIAAIVAAPSGAIGSQDGAGGGSLYLASALVGSLYIWWSALQGIRERDFTADIPVSIATIAALAIGEYSAAAVVAVLLLVGGLLEEAVAARAGRALDALEQLLPTTVTVLRDAGEQTIALDRIVVGDLVLVRPGERIAVDGDVYSGRAAVDQAAISGESMPVDKKVGDPVFAGTLATDGALKITTRSVGAETMLGQIRRIVADAEQSKAPVERILDRYARLYTPIAIVLAGILWAISGSATSAITMLIIFCPCVMVLATPTALVASIGNAALRGSLVKQGAAVEAMGAVTTLLLDKTGTLTVGQPRLTDITMLADRDESEILALAGGAERFSEHPLAGAITGACVERAITLVEPSKFTPLPGRGVRATVAGYDVVIGGRRLLSEQGVRLDEADSALDGVLVAVDGRPAARLTFADQIRPGLEATIARLRQLGIRSALITGDGEQEAQRVASALGIEEVRADLLPTEKAAVVTELKARGERVAFVGDGVNDGPALATADVGIAMGVTGTDLALKTAEVALLSDRIDTLPHLFGLSRRAMSAIGQNLAFSLVILAVAVVLTFAGILQPVSGALMHELSSIPVIANSARLIGTRHTG